MAARVDHVARHDHVGGGEDLVGLRPIARLPVEDVVVLAALLVVADDGRAVVQRRASVDDRVELLVLTSISSKPARRRPGA